MKKISFSKRPIPLPVDYRPLYKLAQIVLILKLVCRNDSSKLLKLHLFSWALKNEKNMNELRRFIISNYSSEFSVWGIEPTLNRALDFALAESICIYEKGKYTLTEKGENFYELIKDDIEILKEEKEYLIQIGKNKITDNRLNKITSKWKLFNA